MANLMLGVTGVRRMAIILLSSGGQPCANGSITNSRRRYFLAIQPILWRAETVPQENALWIKTIL